MREQQILGYISGIRDEFILEAQPKALAARIPDGESGTAAIPNQPPPKALQKLRRWRPMLTAAAIALSLGLHLAGFAGMATLLEQGGASSSAEGSSMGDFFGNLFPFLNPETEPPHEVTIRDLDDVTEPSPPPDTRTECERGNHDWVFADPGDATCYRAGTVTYTCSLCEETKTEAEKLPHVHENGYCTVCGMIEGAWEEVSMEGYGNGDLNGDVYAVIFRVQGEPAGKLILPNLYYSDFWDRMVPVTEIREYAVSRQTAVTEVVIPDTVTVIGHHAFSGCSALEWVNFPAGLTSVGTNAFYGCEQLRMAYLPDTVTELGEGVFQNCKALETASFPAGVEDIPLSMYSNCEKLYIVHYAGDIRTIGIGAFHNCRLLAETPPLHKVTEIGTGAFEGCRSLTEVTLPATLKKLDHYLFRYCSSLKKVTIEANSMREICDHVFEGCTSLQEISLPQDPGAFTGQNMFGQCNALTIRYAGTREKWQSGYKDLKLPLNTTVIFTEEDVAE